MGVFADLFATSKPEENVVDVAASLAPFYVNNNALNVAGGAIAVPRLNALSVPAVARANGIITSTIGSLPIEKFNDASGERIPIERSFKQPDPRVPASLIYSYLAQDLWLYGVAYGQVMEMYAASDGGRVRRWTRIDPQWVTVKTNPLGTEIIGYSVSGYETPMSGVGSIIQFFNLADSGILNRAGRTIRAAIELEKAAELYAREPLPTMVLKSTGTNLPSERRSLIDFSLRPILTAIESRLSMDDFTPAGTHVRFDLDDFLRGNPLERAQIYQILTGIGAMTVEEVRKAEDLLG
jgi:hypothetical protein